MKKIVSLVVLAVTLIAAALSTSCEEISADKKAALKALITLAEQKHQDDHTSASWAPFLAALDNAKEVISRNKPTAEAIDEAIDSLIEAMTALVDSEVLRKELSTAISTAEAWLNNNYTEESWNAFQNALTEAKRVYDDHSATVSQLESILSDLLTAFESLVVA